MVNKKINLILGILLVIGMLNFVVGVEISYCCEKTKNNAWCQNAPQTECSTETNPFTDEIFRMSPSSCDSTSYCSKGCCYSSSEGTCMQNTPQIVCNKDSGVWSANAQCAVPQCELGCCFMGNQAAFVTQTRCGKLSADYGLPIDFRTDIGSEEECLSQAFSESEGACTYETEGRKTCKFITKGECDAMSEEGSMGDVEFHLDFLCSAEELGVDCSMSKQTACFPGKDEVYFIDTCGNRANIYNSKEVSNPEYWEKVKTKEESCQLTGTPNNKGVPGSDSCGNCDYLSGSICKEYQRNNPRMLSPKVGNFVCKNLNCEYIMRDSTDPEVKTETTYTYLNGESWCANSPGTAQVRIASEIPFGDGEEANEDYKMINRVLLGVDDEKNKLKGVFSKGNLPGSRYVRLVCFDGEVTVEPCADFRQEVCLQSAIPTTSMNDKVVDRVKSLGGKRQPFVSEGDAETGFFVAQCRVNRWQDCYQQDNEKDCNNPILRDCVYVDDQNLKNQCVPLFGPGYNFWEEGGDAETICSRGDNQCAWFEETNIFNFRMWGHLEGDGGLDDAALENRWCKASTWEKGVRENFCFPLGDCGSNKANYVGDEGESYDEVDSKKVKK